MRRMLVTVAVFVLGLGIGGGLTRLCSTTGATLPVFSVTEPTAAQLPTQLNTEQTNGQDQQTGFPFALEYTSLLAEKLIAYEGAYLEDGSEENVVDIAALVLTNTGTTGIEYAQFSLMQNGRELTFDATYIPPKSTILLLEENKQPYSGDPVTACRCRTVIPGVFDRSEREVQVRETGLCTLEITNLTDQKLDCARVFYKHHEGAKDIYVGGITYSAVIPDLEPGETRTITPYRYASGYTQVVAVSTK